jgi:SAM-dependent methyltransferase
VLPRWVGDKRRERQERRLDRRLGIETCGRDRDLAALGANGEHRPHANGYEPIQIPVFDAILRSLPIAPRDYCFVDYGSGKGRALILAAEAGFKRVIGVEFASALNVVAARNIESYRRSRPTSPPIEVHGQDAAAFDLPADAAVLFFYNPFDDVVLEKVVARIEHDWRARPRDLVVAYRNPKHAAAFEGAGFLALHFEHPWFRIYRTNAAL